MDVASGATQLIEKEVDCFLESQEEQFTFEEFYCMLGPWALGRQKEVLAALKRLVNGYSVSPATNHGRRRRERGHGRARVPTQSCRASRAQQLGRRGE